MKNKTILMGACFTLLFFASGAQACIKISGPDDATDGGQGAVKFDKQAALKIYGSKSFERETIEKAVRGRLEVFDMKDFHEVKSFLEQYTDVNPEESEIVLYHQAILPGYAAMRRAKLAAFFEKELIEETVSYILANAEQLEAEVFEGLATVNKSVQALKSAHKYDGDTTLNALVAEWAIDRVANGKLSGSLPGASERDPEGLLASGIACLCRAYQSKIILERAPVEFGNGLLYMGYLRMLTDDAETCMK